LHRQARAARQLQRVAGQGKAGHVGQGVHAGQGGQVGAGVFSWVVLAIICA
jgi:hypothetical protein